MHKTSPTRITFNMTLIDALCAMSGGNPGAIRVMTDLLNQGQMLDPDGAFGGFGLVLDLDTYAVHDEKIWMLYKDVCREDLTSVVVVLRALQLGFVDTSTVHIAIQNRGKGIDLNALAHQVLDFLPAFGGPQRAALEARVGYQPKVDINSLGIVDKTIDHETVMSMPSASTETIIESAQEVAS